MSEQLAYVFWHWKRADVETGRYEDRQRAFHRALAASPPSGYRGSFSARVSGAPWVADGGPGYEDWYLVDDFSALGELNEAAVSGRRREPHDAAARSAAGGAGGLYGLCGGEALGDPAHAYWFGKPEGMDYDSLFAGIEPLLAEAGGALWQRQLVLGPAPEFCVQTSLSLSLPDALAPTAPELTTVWSGRD